MMTLNSQLNVVRVGKKTPQQKRKNRNIFVFLHSQRFPVLPFQLPASSGEGQLVNFFLKCDLQSESIVWLGWSSPPFSPNTNMGALKALGSVVSKW